MGIVGVSLGLLGGGGSILAVPVLVYVARLPAREAVVDWFGEPTRVAPAGGGFTGGFAASLVRRGRAAAAP